MSDRICWTEPDPRVRTGEWERRRGGRGAFEARLGLPGHFITYHHAQKAVAREVSERRKLEKGRRPHGLQRGALSGRFIAGP